MARAKGSYALGNGAVVTMGTTYTGFVQWSIAAGHFLNIYWMWGDGTYRDFPGYGGISGPSTSNANWNPPIATMAPYIPNETAGVGSVLFLEWDETGYYLGVTSLPFTGIIPDYGKPVATVTALPLTTPEFNLMYGSGGYFVKGKSSIGVNTSSFSGYYGSTFNRVELQVGNQTKTFYSMGNNISEVINQTGLLYASARIYDSRGRFTSYTPATASGNFQDYSPPQITYNPIKILRCSSGGTEDPTQGTHLKMTLEGSLAAVNNAASGDRVYKVGFKEKGAASGYTYYTFPSSGVTIASSYIASGISLDKEFEAIGSIKDYYTTINTNPAYIPTSFVLMDFHSSGRGMAIGKVAESSGILDMGLPVNHLDIVGPHSIDLGGLSCNLKSGCSVSLPGTIPVMTSNTSSGTASGTSVYGAGTEAFRAFTKSYTNQWHSAAITPPASASAQILYYDYPGSETRTIRSYSLTALYPGVAWMPTKWILQGSNNNWVSFTDLHIATGSVTTWWSGETKYFTVTNPGSYAQYRWKFTDCMNPNNNPTYYAVAEADLYEEVLTGPNVKVSSGYIDFAKYRNIYYSGGYAPLLTNTNADTQYLYIRYNASADTIDFYPTTARATLSTLNTDNDKYLTLATVQTPGTGTTLRMVQATGLYNTLPAYVWHNGTYENNWSTFAADANFAQPASFIKDAYGFVTIRGLIAGGTVGQSAFTLPVGFRPQKSSMFTSINDAGAMTHLRFYNFGSVYVYASSTNGYVVVPYIRAYVDD